MSTSPIPEGFHTLTPYLVVDGAEAAIDYYKRAFGAELIDISYMPGSKTVMNAQIRIGNSMLMLNDEFPDWGSVGPLKMGGTPVSVHMYVENVDEVFNRAIQEGGTSVMPVEDTFWGDRFGVLTDPFGHKWSVSTHVKDMTPEEMEEAAQQAFSQE